MVDTNDAHSSPATSPVFRIVSTLISIFTVFGAFGLLTLAFPLGEAAMYLAIGYVWVFAIIGGISKFSSSAGTTVNTPIGAPMQWRPVFMIVGIFTFIMSGAIALTTVFTP